MITIFRRWLYAGFFLLSIASYLFAGWLDESMVNTVSVGKQAGRGTDTPWSLVCSPDGRVHAVWEDKRDSQNLNIYYRGKTPSATWDTWDNLDINISPVDSTALIGHPSIGALENGSLISVFAEEKSWGGELIGAVLPAGLTCWSQPEFVSIPGGRCLSFNSTGWQTTIATNGHRAVTFWPYIGDDLDNYRPIFYRRYEDGIWENTESPLNLPDIGLTYYAKNLSAVWARQDTIYLTFAGIRPGEDIYSIFFLKMNFTDGTLADYSIIVSDSLISQEFPYICRQTDSSQRENIYIAYDSRENGNIARLTYKKESMTSWSAPIQIGDTGITSGYPCLAANPAGTIELAYELPGNEPSSQIYHRTFYPDRDTFGLATRVSCGDNFSKRPVIACDKYGNTHITYISNRLNPYEPGDEDVYYRMFDSPPLPPENVKMTGNTINWDYNDPPDLWYFFVFYINGADTNLVGGTLNHYFRHNFDSQATLGVRAVDLKYQNSLLVIATSISAITERDINPTDFTVGPNYPNPFNNCTTIPIFGGSLIGDGVLQIYNLLGQTVAEIGFKTGDRSVVLGGTDQNAILPSSGVYYYRAVTGKNQTPIGRMLLIK